MTNDNRKTIDAKDHWFTALADAWQQCAKAGNGAPGLAEVADVVALRVGVGAPIALGWLRACETAAGYASAPLEFEHDAIDEEQAGAEAARRATLPIMQARLQARVEAHDRTMEGHVTCPLCQEVCLSRGQLTRRWHSTLGPIVLKRRWSWCEADKQGVADAQRWLRLPDGQYTARLAEAITLVATTVPHGMAAELMGKLLNVKVSERGVQDIVEQRAAPLVALQDAEASRLKPWNADGSERLRPRPRDAIAEADAPEIAYMEVDGVFPMTRTEIPEAAVPAPAGSRGGKGRRYKLEGKEVKNAVLYTGKACVEESDSRGAILEKKYVSHLGNCHDFTPLLWAQMRRMRFDQAKLLVLLSDGADWIREFGGWLPIPVLLILDLFHAKHRVWEVAHALFGDKTPEAKTWADEQNLRIEAGEVELVIQALRFVKTRKETASDLASKLVTYFENNKVRMNYPAYRARGIRVSSSTVESANYHVTGARLKLQGMRWSVQAAGQMARLRADLYNGNWEKRTRELMAA